MLTVVNMSLASPKSAGENTLDMLEIMTRAFDESEGGEGTHPPGKCKGLDESSPYWSSPRIMVSEEVYGTRVTTVSGWIGFIGNMPAGSVEASREEDALVGANFNCEFAFFSSCCQLDVGIVYFDSEAN